jgi:hypothetical protein
MRAPRPRGSQGPTGCDGPGGWEIEGRIGGRHDRMTGHWRDGAEDRIAGDRAHGCMGLGMGAPPMSPRIGSRGIRLMEPRIELHISPPDAPQCQNIPGSIRPKTPGIEAGSIAAITAAGPSGAQPSAKPQPQAQAWRGYRHSHMPSHSHRPSHNHRHRQSHRPKPRAAIGKAPARGTGKTTTTATDKTKATAKAPFHRTATEARVTHPITQPHPIQPPHGTTGTATPPAPQAPSARRPDPMAPGSGSRST